MSRALDASLFLLLAILWGLSFPAIAVGLEYLPPLLFAAFRYDVAAVLLLAYAAVRIDGWRPSARNDLAAIAGGGLFLVAGNGLLFVGQQTVPSGVAAILQSLVPIVTAVWALFLLGERLSPVGAAGVAVGFLGVGFIIQPEAGNLLAGDTVGRLIIVGQVVSVALGGVLVQRAGPTIDRVAFTGWAMLVGALVLHAVSLGAGELPGGDAAAATAIGAVVYLGVFSTAVAFLIYFAILEEHGAFEAALVAYLVPVVATIVGVFVLGESISALSIVGFGLVAVGFALVKRHALVDAFGAVADVGRP
ncbi:EamA family transporter [Halovivax sp.]|uniref:DMT family transporter n=1 Tax=Halovivax sp. TaxID=1935978 RepID=UPI0025C236DA|nr:EamA family transporter [Halovivax sp.]